MEVAICALYYALVVLGVSVLLFFKHWRKPDGVLFPRGPPGCWPILGHLPLFAVGCPHHTLAHLSLKQGYGAIIGLRLGCIPAVVVSTAALAKEVLATHDKIFANRPRYLLSDSLLYGYDNGIIFSSCGPRWAKLRKMCIVELFTAKRLQELQHVRQERVRGLLQKLLEASRSGTQALCLRDFFGDMTSDTMSSLLQSKTLSEAGGDSLPELVKELVHEIAPTLGDFVPWLRALDFLRRRRMKDIHDRLDNIIDSIISTRRQACMQDTQPRELPHDFLQVLLSKGLGGQEEPLTSEEIKGIMLDILSGGTHTTAATLEWAMVELLRNPRCYRKLQDEIDAVVGKGEQVVSDEDLPKLPYLENIVKEVFRLHPLGPLLAPRVSSQDTNMDGYILSANTLVLVNVWAIGRDPKVWKNAEDFVPERFEEGGYKEIDVRGNHFELLPFGAGRRMCPGMRLALSMFHVTLANLVKSFDWELPPGQTYMSMDMSEKRGIASCKSTPLLAIPKLRL